MPQQTLPSLTSNLFGDGISELLNTASRKEDYSPSLLQPSEPDCPSIAESYSNDATTYTLSPQWHGPILLRRCIQCKFGKSP